MANVTWPEHLIVAHVGKEKQHGRRSRSGGCSAAMVGLVQALLPGPDDVKWTLRSGPYKLSSTA